MTRVLLTGFEPFGDLSLNVSAQTVALLQAQTFPFELHTTILPVDAARAPIALGAALAELRPDYCIMLGQAKGISELRIERVAVNLCDFGIPDNAGQQLRDQPVSLDGPAAYFTTVSPAQLLHAARAAGVPTNLSLSAGSYLCNMVFYSALHLCAEEALPTRCVFVHLPLLPTQVADHETPSMPQSTIAAGLRAMLHSLASALPERRPTRIAAVG